MKELKAAAAQIRPDKNDPEGNAKKHIAFMEKAKDEGAQLLLFPECSLTGYASKGAEELALPVDSEYIKSIEKASDELGLAVCFGYIEKRDGGLSICQEIYSEHKKTLYRKTHLGLSEQLYFEEGSSFPVCEIKGVRIGMQLCWESHIPQISACYRKQGAELLLFPYASGMSGEKCRENWSVHLPARASDNGCFALACNLLSEEKGGGTAFYDPKGKLISSYFGNEERMLFCETGGTLPRELFEKGEETMHSISYFDRARDIFRS